MAPQQEVTIPKTVPELSNSLDDSIAALHTRQRFIGQTYKVWSDSTEEERNFSLEESPNTTSVDDADANSNCTGIILTKSSYYTVPSLDEISSMVDRNNNCFVNNFTVGRKGYGKVMFPGFTNVTGLNIDEIVCFQKKEITVYPDDNKKPPIGEGLNKRAQVTLENVWPTDKTTHTLIMDPDRLEKIGYKEKIKNSTIKLGATFIDYLPDTGSWIFEVEHFSKYGLEDSDEEMDVVKPPENKTNNQTQIGPANGILKNDMLKPTVVHKAAPLPLLDQDMEITTSQLQSQHLDFMTENSLFNDFNGSGKPLFSSVIDTERIQGMKASFFEEEMEEEWGSPLYTGEKDISLSQLKEISMCTTPLSYQLKMQDTCNEGLKKFRYLDQGSEPASPLTRKPIDIGIHNSMSNLSIESSKPSEWLSDFPIAKTSQIMLSASKPVPNILNKIYMKPFKDSVFYNKQNLIADAGYFMGQTFRAGWQADGIFTSLNCPDEDKTDVLDKVLYKTLKLYKMSNRTSGTKTGFSLTLNRVPLYSLQSKSQTSVKNNLVEILDLQLKNSISTRDEGGAPLFVSKPGVESTHELANIFNKQLQDADPLEYETNFSRQCVCVWNLLVALWGKIKGLTDEESNSSYAMQIVRREALSRWLIKSTDPDLTRKIKEVSENDYLKKILLSLTGRQTKAAVNIAQEHKDFRLSLLLSQAEGTTLVRKLILKQLVNWEQNDVCKFIKSDRIALYALLSGMMVWENKHFSVNCCKDMSWKQALSLHLWYQCNSNASIQEALAKYDDSYLNKYSSPPYPPYLENFMEEIEDITEYDTCYHLLKLFCDRSHRFDLLLMPETYTADHLDYRLSWFLHLALSSIGYNISPDLSSTLHSNFAAQLEYLDLWQWAVFVVFHHPDADWRKKSVTDILLRHVVLKENEQMSDVENFLIESLMVPPEWIYKAKAIKASNMGSRASEAWYLLKAGLYSESHNIVVKYLASTAVINEDYDYLMKYLNELSPPERSSTIQDWCSGGQVYVDYIHMCKVVQDVINQETSAYDLEKFTPEVISLCKRLSSIPISSLEDSLSVAEMAKKTATTLSSISLLQATRTKNSSFLTSLPQYLKNLPMPYDYAVPENRFVAHCFLDIITSEN